MKRGIAVAVAVLVLAIALVVAFGGKGGILPYIPQDAGLKTISTNGTFVHVWVADTPDAQAKGLGDREAIAADQGMLFVFPKSDYYAFWMKDMHFPIDILWINTSGVVVDLRQNVSPESYPKVFYPKTQALYVLEVQAGFSEQNNVEIGSHVSL